MELSIVQLPLPLGDGDGSVLRRKAAPVEPNYWSSGRLKELVHEMFRLQYHALGLGLAAPQVGLSLQLAVIDSGRDLPLVLINPRITWCSDEVEIDNEGCLSLPGLMAPLERPKAITVHYTDVRGQPRELTTEGFLARIIQHEVDHLDGKLYVDRLQDLSTLWNVDARTLATNAVNKLYEQAETAPEPPSAQPSAPAAVPSPALQLHEIMPLQALPRAITVAAQLKLDAHLHDGPMSAAELAARTGTDADSLYRLLRALATIDLLIEREHQSFELTPIGAALRFANIGVVGEQAFRAWTAMPYSIQTGKPAFDHAFGMSFYDYLAEHPDVEANYNDWITVTADAWMPVITNAFELPDIGMVVDIGGGQGSLLIRVLQKYPLLRGVLFDLPSVVAESPRLLESAGMSDRCTIVGGSFFESVPADGDVYVLARVLMNWSSEQAVQILQSIRKAMHPNARMLVIEPLIQPLGDPRRRAGAFNDIFLLTMMGARQRSVEEFQALFAASGFELASVTPVHDWGIVEGKPI